MEYKTAVIEGQTIVCSERTFSTGSVGFYGTGKIVMDGDRYQVSVQMVKIGSKPTSPTGKKIRK